MASNIRVVEPSPTGCTLDTTLAPKDRRSLGRMGLKDCKSQKIRKFVVCLIRISEATVRKFHQHGSLNMISIRTTPIDMLSWKGQRSWNFNTAKQLYYLKNSASGRHDFPQGKHSWLSRLVVLRNIHVNYTNYTD